jgi:hypothetical protein
MQTAISWPVHFLVINKIMIRNTSYRCGFCHEDSVLFCFAVNNDQLLAS